MKNLPNLCGLLRIYELYLDSFTGKEIKMKLPYYHYENKLNKNIRPTDI